MNCEIKNGALQCKAPFLGFYIPFIIIFHQGFRYSKLPPFGRAGVGSSFSISLGIA